MKLLKLALLLMFTAAAYGLRSYTNARRNATAADSPALTHALLIYPVVDNNLQHSSYIQNAHAKPLDLAMRMHSFFASSAESDRVTGRFPQGGPRTLRHDARRMARQSRLRTAHPVDDRRHRRVQIQIPFKISF